MKTLSLLKLGRRNIKSYGVHVITQRAVPDVRDALKVVHRRILWTMFKDLKLQPKGPTQVAQKVMSATQGDYHPHSPEAVFDAIVTMSGTDNYPHPLVYGKGNWGSYNKPAGAPRYIGCKLSEVASKYMLDPDYLAVVDMENNYNGERKEPVYLPATLPFILLNGGFGIAVGATSAHPPLHPETVDNYINQWLKNGVVKPTVKNLRFNWYWGSECVAEEERIKQWLATGTGALAFSANYDSDSHKRTVTFTDVPPFFNWKNITKALRGDTRKKYDFVSGFNDLTDKNTADRKVKLQVKFKNSVNEDFDERVQDIVDLFTNSFSCNSNVTIRKTSEKVEFEKYNLATLVDVWMRYRVDLEVRAQDFIAKKIQSDIDHQNLLKLAIDNIDLVIKTIRKSTEPKEDLVRKLSITHEQAETIVAIPLGRISRISETEIIKKKQNLVKERKAALSYRDNPNPKVQSDLKTGFEFISK